MKPPMLSKHQAVGICISGYILVALPTSIWLAEMDRLTGQNMGFGFFSACLLNYLWCRVMWGIGEYLWPRKR